MVSCKRRDGVHWATPEDESHTAFMRLDPNGVDSTTGTNRVEGTRKRRGDGRPDRTATIMDTACPGAHRVPGDGRFSERTGDRTPQDTGAQDDDAVQAGGVRSSTASCEEAFVSVSQDKAHLAFDAQATSRAGCQTDKFFTRPSFHETSEKIGDLKRQPLGAHGDASSRPRYSM